MLERKAEATFAKSYGGQEEPQNVSILDCRLKTEAAFACPLAVGQLWRPGEPLLPAVFVAGIFTN